MSRALPIERRLGYRFRNKKLLSLALTHRSRTAEKKSEANNERLEFLGDAVLELALSEYLYAKGTFNEAEMSRLRAWAVKGTELTRTANELSLGDYLILGRGEEATGGRGKSSILSGAMEAVFGAVYLDGGYEEARRVIMGLTGCKLEETIKSGKSRDPKTELQELSQRLYGSLPLYKVIEEEGREHEKIFTVAVSLRRRVHGRGKGASKKEAERLAALEALKKLSSSGH